MRGGVPRIRLFANAGSRSFELPRREPVEVFLIQCSPWKCFHLHSVLVPPKRHKPKHWVTAIVYNHSGRCFISTPPATLLQGVGQPYATSLPQLRLNSMNDLRHAIGSARGALAARRRMPDRLFSLSGPFPPDSCEFATEHPKFSSLLVSRSSASMKVSRLMTFACHSGSDAHPGGRPY